uniref:Uncharacterized protein n=1 Tax=Arundo donax TaxID=35708 RepID=A0A0A8ZX39_ARUDO
MSAATTTGAPAATPSPAPTPSSGPTSSSTSSEHPVRALITKLIGLIARVFVCCMIDKPVGYYYQFACE